ncbi:hypothetical protein U1Q18_027989, partial [Sarracenia purpurea var. burkii]
MLDLHRWCGQGLWCIRNLPLAYLMWSFIPRPLDTYGVLGVEGTNCIVSELAEMAAQERAMLEECEALLASTAAML